MSLYAGMTVNERLVISGQMATACSRSPRTWMPGTSSAKTRFALLPGHDETDLRDPHDEVYALSACSRSAIRSSLSSMPIDRRTTSGAAPDFTWAAASSWLWVVEAGWITSERVSPTLARCENSFRFDTRLTPAS